jgi:hypothetical protein
LLNLGSPSCWVGALPFEIWATLPAIKHFWSSSLDRVNFGVQEWLELLRFEMINTPSFEFCSSCWPLQVSMVSNWWAIPLVLNKHIKQMLLFQYEIVLLLLISSNL